MQRSETTLAVADSIVFGWLSIALRRLIRDGSPGRPPALRHIQAR